MVAPITQVFSPDQIRAIEERYFAIMAAGRDSRGSYAEVLLRGARAGDPGRVRFVEGDLVEEAMPLPPHLMG